MGGCSPFLQKESSEFEGNGIVDSADLGFYKITSLGCLRLVRERGFYFWRKPKVAKTFLLGAFARISFHPILRFVRESTPLLVFGR